MPNTLAHLGVAGVATRSIIKSADLKWIYVGAIIPDLPWIFQRLGGVIFPNINLYDLRLYVIIQSTLFFSLILSFALASLSREYSKTFLILAFGSLIHLLLDSLQKKWANGALLFAPFNWDLFNLNLFWPESLATYLITLFGLIYFIFFFKKGINALLNLELINLKRWGMMIFFLLIFFILPLFLLDQPLNANNHYVKTLKNVSEREGKYFEMDRRSYRFENGVGIINTFAKEDIILQNFNLKTKEVISFKAKFINENTAYVLDYHIHSVIFRDGSSYAGLLMILIFWGASFYRNRNELKAKLPSNRFKFKKT